ncbi:Heat shock 70 kDa protein 12A [Leucoagaricus sp. SymC.cos]|nr:Heat shock 70 kDa protein 12A [Leucoagaricus sp. SymC.cos]
MPPRAPYTGKERKLVLAFDVGTTFSGISYAILDPNNEPKIHPVTRFPGRALAGGDAKVPTVIYYTENGTVGAIGAETEREGFDALVEDSSWVKAEWFKLHLRPKTRTTSSVSEEIPALPPGKSAVDVFADFLMYMKQCAKTYIEESHPVDGSGLWQSDKKEYILSHPNAWEGAQQTMMRKAAIQAGLITCSASDQERIHFISEGEASLNFCLDRGLTNSSIKPNLPLDDLFLLTVFLVGGFAASDYLFAEVERRLQSHGFVVCRPDPHLNKAVPDGSIAGYLRPSVKTRVSKFTYGVRCSRVFDSFCDIEIARRASTMYRNLSGKLMVPGVFSEILVKNTQVSDTQEFRRSYREESLLKEGLAERNSTHILCYRGTFLSPQFIDKDPENFHQVITINADTSSLVNQARLCTGLSGNYYELEYDIVMLFGLTELKVQLAWKEDGTERRSPAEVVFDTEIEYKD